MNGRDVRRNEKLLQDPTRLRQISERIPAGRWGQPNDFAGPVVFLASDASQYVCGELLVVDGVSDLRAGCPATIADCLVRHFFLHLCRLDSHHDVLQPGMRCREQGWMGR